LIAKDKDEALNLVETFRKAHTKSELFEQLFIPTLIACRRDHQQHKLTDEDREFIIQIIRQVIKEDPTSISGEGDLRATEVIEDAHTGTSPILGVPANDEADELALLMLAELLADEDQRMRVLSVGISGAPELIEAERNRLAAICIGFLPQGPTLPVRQFCRHLSSRFPTLPLVLGRWSAGDQENTRRRFAGLALEFGWTLTTTRDQLIQHQQKKVSCNRITNGDWLKQREQPLLNGQWIGPKKVEIKFMEQQL